MGTINKQTTENGIIAIYQYLDDFESAVSKIYNRDDFAGCEMLSHTSYHELMHLAEKKYGFSEVRWFTLVGTLSGVITGFGMPLWMDYNWPLVTGGKWAGIYSLPAYVIFAFELMVLFGAIATILGMLVMGRMPNPSVNIRDKRTTDDRFAIFVPNKDLESDEAKLLEEWGAQEVYTYK